ncbi:hypothetical protein AM1_5284 [Acaryochloris marina MBIC11017]|uniref:Uncharacterized protein n=1 Tax=Acaryochloris marina (strain MBIC 11017) TaxID=329726 RepID=B0CAP4_ACAM1|nr:hypothetical protein AM1_5284 [Acaryochloris marina MBIC11017]
MLSSIRLRSILPVHSAFAFFNRGPQLIYIDDVSRNGLNALIVNH